MNLCREGNTYSDPRGPPTGHYTVYCVYTNRSLHSLLRLHFIRVVLVHQHVTTQFIASAFYKSCVRLCLQSTNVHYQEHLVSREKRAELLGQKAEFRGCTVWLTGLSGAGKTTISFALEEYFVSHGVPAYSLDSEDTRLGINSDLGFSVEEREENIRRVSEIAKLFADGGIVCFTSFISPSTKERDNARQRHRDSGIKFFEVFVDAPLEVCEKRDVKGLYKQVREGKIAEFTGIDQIYEVPEKPDLVIKTAECTINESMEQVLKFLRKEGIVPLATSKEVLDLFVPEEMLDEAQREAQGLLALDLDDIDMQWLQVLAEGWATPLHGFMRETEYLQCLHYKCLLNDAKLNQSIPIVLSITDAVAKSIAEAATDVVQLRYGGRAVAILRSLEVYPHRREERCARELGTTAAAAAHPSVRRIMAAGEWLVGGDVEVLGRVRWNDGLDEFRLTPKELREKFTKMKGDCVFAFQLRTPLNNGHLLLIEDTRRRLLQRGYHHPILLLHPVGGGTGVGANEANDVPLPLRMRQYLAYLGAGAKSGGSGGAGSGGASESSPLLDAASTVLAIFPSPMVYGGPTEVQWHARARIVCGANYFVVGRDPAGIADPASGQPFYDPTHGNKVLTMAPGLTQLDIIPFRVAAYDQREKRMAFYETARREDFLFFTEARLRFLACKGETPPEAFMPPHAWRIVASHYQPRSQEEEN